MQVELLSRGRPRARRKDPAIPVRVGDEPTENKTLLSFVPQCPKDVFMAGISFATGVVGASKFALSPDDQPDLQITTAESR